MARIGADWVARLHGSTMNRVKIFISLALLISAGSSGIFAKSKELILGEKAYSRGSFDAAKQHFEQAIDNGDESGDPRLYIGLILESRRQYAESIPYFRAAAERPMQKKFKKVAYWKLAILYRQAKQYPESLRYVERLEEIGEKSELFEKIRMEAEGYHGGGGSSKGYTDVKKAIGLEKQYKEKSSQGAEAGDLCDIADSIIAAYNSAIAADPRWKEYRFKIALYHERCKSMGEAERVYTQIWDEARDPAAAYKLGLLARKRKDYKSALKFFGGALENPPEDLQMRFYIHYNAAQAHYALGNLAEAYAHARPARRLSGEVELKKKTQQALRRLYCLAKISKRIHDEEYCRFSQKTESKMFMSLYAMKRALAENNSAEAAQHAVQIYAGDTVDDDESGASLPAYALSDLPVAVGVLFKEEKYRAVIDLTTKFKAQLQELKDTNGWRAVSHFALKEYGSALVEFDQIKNPTPSQMNLHLMAMAHMGDIAGIKAKGKIYLKDARARKKLTENFRKMRLYETLRREPDFEIWLNESAAVTATE